MAILIIGLVVFLGVHSISIVARDQRMALAERMGEGPYKGVYSLIALVGLILIIYGYGLTRADPVVLWNPPTFTRHVAALLMIFVFPLLFAAYLPGRIQATVKHPMLAGVKIWAFAHLISNGTLADLVLFGSFLAWAVVDRISVKRRGEGPSVAGVATNDMLAIALGLAVYILFAFSAHEWLFGVSPFG
jgi:uncharacterized membrane protein